MRFNIPKTGRYQKYHSKKQQKDLESTYAVLDRLKESRLRYIEYPDKKNGLTPSDSIRWFFQVLLYRVVALAEGGISAWNEGNPLVSILAARSLLETVALALYIIEESDKLMEKDQPKEVNNLIQGASFSYAPLPYRDKLRKMPSITTMIDKLGRYMFPSETKSPVRASYNTISNIAHPSWHGAAGLYSKPIPSEKRHYFNAGIPKEPKIFQQLLSVYSLLGIFVILMQKSRGLSDRLAKQGN